MAQGTKVLCHPPSAAFWSLGREDAGPGWSASAYDPLPLGSFSRSCQVSSNLEVLSALELLPAMCGPQLGTA